MNAPVAVRERRQAPRTKAQRLAYINLEPDNGGIILNVSEGGLGFHATAPVQPAKVIHFSITERNRRIEGEGELAWTDESRKRGGLRFISLPDEAREQVLSWIRQPGITHRVEDDKVGSLPLPHEIPQFRASEDDLRARREIAISRASEERKRAGLLSGFSGGLITGLLVSLLFGVAFLLHGYRQQVGESLVHLGQRLGARTESPLPSSLQAKPEPTQTTSLPPAQVVAPPRPQPAPPIERETPQPEITIIRREPVKTAAETQVPTVVASSPRGTGSHAQLPTSPVPPPISIPALSVNRPPAIPMSASITRVELATNDAAVATPSISQMYFEVGKYKQKDFAQRISDQLSQLGFHTTVGEKGSIWRNSYYVLVGPYGYDSAAEAAHEDLLSHGFQARAYERGSRSFVLRPGLMLNRNKIPAGDCEIRWESYVTDAKVKFLQHDFVVVSAKAKWVQSDSKFENNAIVYRINADRSLTLLEIRFAGMDRALVFGES